MKSLIVFSSSIAAAALLITSTAYADSPDRALPTFRSIDLKTPRSTQIDFGIAQESSLVTDSRGTRWVDSQLISFKWRGFRSNGPFEPQKAGNTIYFARIKIGLQRIEGAPQAGTNPSDGFAQVHGGLETPPPANCDPSTNSGTPSGSSTNSSVDPKSLGLGDAPKGWSWVAEISLVNHDYATKWSGSLLKISVEGPIGRWVSMSQYQRGSLGMDAFRVRFEREVELTPRLSFFATLFASFIDVEMPYAETPSGTVFGKHPRTAILRANTVLAFRYQLSSDWQIEASGSLQSQPRDEGIINDLEEITTKVSLVRKNFFSQGDRFELFVGAGFTKRNIPTVDNTGYRNEPEVRDNFTNIGLGYSR